MFNVKRLLLVSAIALGCGVATAQIATAQTVGLPPAIATQLTSAGGNLQAVALSIATASPALTTSVLQSTANIAGLTSEAAANAVKAFADQAAALLAAGAGHNPALAAALAVSVENIVGDANNAAMVNGPFAAIIAAAKAEADQVLLNAEVQQAIADGAPGTQVQAAINDGAFGSFGPGPTNGGPVSSKAN